MIEKIANLLGIEPYEEFKIKPSEKGRILGYETNEDRIYRLDTELVHKGYNDGWSKWYGGHEKEFYYLVLGLYEVVKNSNDDSNNERMGLIKEKDFSLICDRDCNTMDNNCCGCIWFYFPIGCLIDEVE